MAFKSVKKQLEEKMAAEAAAKNAAPETAPEVVEAQAQNPTTLPVEVVQAVKEFSRDDDFDAKVTAAVAKALGAQGGSAIDYAKLGQAVGQAIVAAEAAKEMTAHQRRLEDGKKKSANEERCHLCAQVVGDGRGKGCGGPFARNKNGSYKMEPAINPDGSTVVGPDDAPVMRRIEDYHQFHEQVVVFPREPMALQCWDGIKINGAIYMSQGPGHFVWVPKNGKDTIMSHLSGYEQGERDARIPKKRARHGGTVNGRTGGHSGPGVGDGWNTQSVM